MPLDIDDDADLGAGFSLREMYEPSEPTAEAASPPDPAEVTVPAAPPAAPAAAPAEVNPPAPETTAERQTVVRDKLRALGYEIGDDEDDDALLAEIEQAHAAARDPATRQLIEYGRRYQQHAPAFEAWHGQQMTGGAPAPTPAPAPAPEAPKGPLADWNEAPPYDARWEKVCAWNAEMGQYVLKPEAVGMVDPSIPRNLTAHRQWLAERGDRVVREFPKLAEQVVDHRLTDFEAKVMEKVTGILEERVMASQLSADINARKADLYHLDPQTGEILVDPQTGREMRKPLGDLVARRSFEFKTQILGLAPNARLTTAQKAQAHRYAIPLGYQDYAVLTAQQAPAAPAPAAPAAETNTPSASEPVESPKKRFIDEAIETAKKETPGGSHRGAARPTEIDDDTEFENDARVTFSDIAARHEKRLKANGRV